MNELDQIQPSLLANNDRYLSYLLWSVLLPFTKADHHPHEGTANISVRFFLPRTRWQDVFDDASGHP